MASAIGQRVLQDGGNAVDAAVGTALALAVTYPQAGNLGGGGFLMAHMDGESHFLDYRETAPRGAVADLFLEDGRITNKTVLGGASVGVPGTVAGLSIALSRFGTWSWDRILSLVIPMAETGVWLTSRQSACLELYRESLSTFESTRKIFVPGGRVPQPGSLFRQPELAWTLRQLADHGPEAFYVGEIARKIAEEVRRNGGVLDLEDLASYSPRWRAPLTRTAFGRKIFAPSLPSAGGLVLVLSLGLLEANGYGTLPRGSLERADLLARIFRVAFAFEHRNSGDPDYLDPARVDQAYGIVEGDLNLGDLERLEARLPEAAKRSDMARSCTTHFSVIDRHGNAVSNTYTLNTMFGSKLMVDGAGFLLNNCLDDFRIGDAPNWYDLLQGDRNQLRPNYRPVSSMTPVILTKDGKAELIVGGSGGPRIPTSVAQMITGVLQDGLTLGEALRAPRVHHQLFPDEVALELNVPESIAEGLSKLGHRVARVTQLGIGAAIRRNENDEISAILDGRFGDFW